MRHWVTWGLLGALAAGIGCGGKSEKQGAAPTHGDGTSGAGGSGGTSTSQSHASTATSTGGSELSSTSEGSVSASGGSSNGAENGGTTGGGAGAMGGDAGNAGETGAAGSAGVDSDVGEFCARWGEAACSASVVEFCGSDTASCRSAQQEYCMGLFEGAEFDARYAESCLEAVSSAFEDGNLVADELRTVRGLENDCDAVAIFSDEDEPPCEDCNGDLAPAAPCTDSRQCGEDWYCGFEGRCAARGELGDACASDRPCENQLYCVVVGDTEGTCLAIVRLGRANPLCSELGAT